MSRGPGRIERAIAAAFEAEPDEAFSTDELCALAYPGVNRIEKKHRVAVIRAGERVCARMPAWAAWQSSEATGPLIWANRYSVPSYTLMRARKAYPREPLDAQRRMLEHGGKFYRAAQEGGPWWRQVQLMIAARDGDRSERTAELEQQQQKDAKLLAEMMRRPLG